MADPETATRPTLPAAWRRLLVIGLGTSGQAVIAALASEAPYIDVVVVDERDDAVEAAARARALGAEVHLGEDPLGWIDDVDVVVPSPGVSEHAPSLRAAMERGIPIVSEPELGIRLAPRRLVVISGTNGKTSVTELVTAMLVEAGQTAHACGNIGEPVTTVALASAPDDVLVAELSSFQLRFCQTLRPEVGVLLNLADDHLDWHGSIAAYGHAKSLMWQAQGQDDWAVVNADDAAVRGLATVAHSSVATFTLTDRRPDGVGAHVVDGQLLIRLEDGTDQPLLDIAELPSAAPHLVANVAAAALAAILIGADLEAAARAALAFRPGRHRLEVVAEVDGITFVDDSKATNPHACAAALGSFSSVVWIAGGIAKGVDLNVLAPHLGNVRAAFLIGTSAAELSAVCARAGVEGTDVGDLAAAVSRAAAVAQPGDAVLLAPACSSFDQFRDYRDRGDQFAAHARSVVAARSSS